MIAELGREGGVMAEGRQYVCNSCGHSIEAWTDGNPYYIDENGSKQYAYHPDHERLNKCIGNDSPHLCLSCGHEFMVDSRDPVAACPICGSSEIADTFQLDGRQCPFCKKEVFAFDPKSVSIS